MKKILINEKGFAASDALIALLIIVLFSSIIVTFGYNIYLVNATITRTSKANGYAVTILEEIDKMYYDEINNENDTAIISDNTKNKLIASLNGDTKVEIKDKDDTETPFTAPYKIEIDIKSYNEVMNEQLYLDLVKEIEVRVKYNVGNKEKQILINRVKAREKLIVPNAPDMMALKNEIDNDNLFLKPIKYEDNTWKVTTNEDTTWYNYNNGYWVTVLVSINDLQEGEIVDLTNEKNNTYVWIPRYGYNGINVEFIYYDSNKYVEYTGAYSNLEDIDETQYTVPFEETEKGKWITIQAIEDEMIAESYYTILNSSKYQRKNI